MPNARLTIEKFGDVTVVSITNSAMLDSRSIDATGQELYQMADKQAKRKIIVDFSDVRLLSSQAIGIVLTLHQKVEAIKGRLILCGIRPEIRKVFKLTKIDKLLEILPNEEAALKEFGVVLR